MDLGLYLFVAGRALGCIDFAGSSDASIIGSEVQSPYDGMNLWFDKELGMSATCSDDSRAAARISPAYSHDDLTKPAPVALKL